MANKGNINDIEQEYERILNTYDKDTLITLLSDSTSIEDKEKFIKEFSDSEATT